MIDFMKIVKNDMSMDGDSYNSVNSIIPTSPHMP